MLSHWSLLFLLLLGHVLLAFGISSCFLLNSGHCVGKIVEILLVSGWCLLPLVRIYFCSWQAVLLGADYFNISIDRADWEQGFSTLWVLDYYQLRFSLHGFELVGPLLQFLSIQPHETCRSFSQFFNLSVSDLYSVIYFLRIVL